MVIKGSFAIQLLRQMDKGSCLSCIFAMIKSVKSCLQPAKEKI